MLSHTFSDIKTVHHMTHMLNMYGIIQNGLLTHGNEYQQVDISNPDVNERRERCEDVYHKPIHNYVPFYYNPRNAMLYRNKNKSVIILGFNKNLITSEGALYTNGNAATDATTFSNDDKFLKGLDWAAVFSKRWCNYGVMDLKLKSKMMSELLIPNEVSIDKLEVIYCKNQNDATKIEEQFRAVFPNHIRVIVDQDLFF